MFDKINSDRTCDLLIIGGGFAGLYSAKKLMNLEKEILVVEKNTIGSGRTSIGKDVVFCDGGIALESMTDIDINKTINKFSNLTAALEDLSDTVQEKSFQRRDVLIFSDKKNDLLKINRRFHIEKFNQNDSTMITEDPTADFSFNIEAAVYTKHSGATVNAVDLSKKLADYLSVNGIFIAENTEITELIPKSDGFSVKTSDGPTIKAKTIIDTRCMAKKRVILTAKTKPVMSSIGWPNDCIIRDMYKNRMTIHRTYDKKITVNYEKKRFFPIFSCRELNFSYMQSVLSSMFFALPNTLFEEKKTVFEESSLNKARIRRSHDFPNLYYFESPYSNGLLSAIHAAERFSTTGIKR